MNKTLLAYLVVFVGGLLAIFVYTNDQNAKDRAGLIAACERVNTLRAQSNITDISVWRNFSAAVQREVKLATTGPNADAHQESAAEIERNSKRIAVTGLTDCGKAIDNPGKYAPPLAGPIGNVRTGKENAEIASIEAQSRERISRAVR